MATVKNKNLTKRQNRPKLQKRPKIQKSAKIAKTTKNPKNGHFSKTTDSSAFCAKTVILTIIILAAIIVVLTTLSAFFFTPEKVVKNEIESLAKNYYENTIYENIIAANAENLNSGQISLDEIMEKYNKKGFSRITLRQLLLIEAELHPNAAADITTYCDENKSFITIFPDPPYGQTDYHIEYTYSCHF